MSNEQIVNAECSSCKGTGVYRGMAEPEGIAVVCLTCNGTGCQQISYTPFTSRKLRYDVDTVRLSHGRFILSCGPTGTAVAYDAFCRGAMPIEES